jgi:integrase
MRERLIKPTRTKTGKKHISMMPPVLADMMQSYLIEVRRKIVDSTGSVSNYFFLGRDGLPVTYAAYDSALKTAGEKALVKNPRLSIENLHTHAGRSTFAAVLRSYQLEQRRQGKVTLTDTDFCNLMDWKSLASLEHYDITTRAQEVSPLLKDFYAQYMNFAEINRS